MRFIALICILILLPAGEPVHAQLTPLLNDTIKINDVVVQGKHILRSAGFTKTHIDSSRIRDNINFSISDVLKSGTALFLKSYGPGGIATISLRGAGASHTVVTWNGVNINSPLLGQSDLFTIPVILADEITIHNGGSSVATAQGGIGGVIEIGTRADWNMNPSYEITTSTGGYNRYSASFIGKYGGDSWSFASRLNLNYSGNNFRYDNPYLSNEIVRERRVNASYLQNVAVQEAWHRSRNAVTGFKVWIQESSRDIPTPINVLQSSHKENLNNSVLRGLVSHDRYLNDDMIWSSVAAVISEQMDYSDKVTSIESNSRFRTYNARTSLLWQLKHGTAIKTGISAEATNADNDGFRVSKSRFLSSLTVSADHRPSKRVDLNANAVLSLVDSAFIAPDFSIGMAVKPYNNSLLIIKTNLAAKSRIPTLNDLYWEPGGNPHLRNERAFNSELSADYKGNIGNEIEIDFAAAVYYNYIKDMITWMPGESGYWSPVNSGEVIARGFESGITAEWSKSNKSVRFKASYSFTRSSGNGKETQLIYVPQHIAYTEIRSNMGRFHYGASWQFTGRRYITTNNDQFLPYYDLTDIWIGFRTNISGNRLETSVRFENVFFRYYQTISYHPMPPGSVLINMAFKIRTSRGGDRS